LAALLFTDILMLFGVSASIWKFMMFYFELYK